MEIQVIPWYFSSKEKEGKNVERTMKSYLYFKRNGTIKWIHAIEMNIKPAFKEFKTKQRGTEKFISFSWTCR